MFFKSCLSAEISAPATSVSSKSNITGTESQSGTRGKGRPRKFIAPPFLDGVEERQRSTQIAAKRGRGRPKKVVCPGGRPLLHSDAADHHIEVLLDNPVQPPAEPVRVADAREGNSNYFPEFICMVLCCVLLMWSVGVRALAFCPLALYCWPPPQQPCLCHLFQHIF